MINENLAEKAIQFALTQYSEGKEDALLLAFEGLVKNVAEYRKMIICDSVMTETVDLCLEKTRRYQDAPKCKAFNYFTTIIGCYLTQIRRMQINKAKRGV